MVHLDDSLTLLGVRSGSSVLHILDSVLDRIDVVYDIVLGDVRLVMTSNEICLVDEVCGLDRCLTESEVRNRYAAGLLGVICEVSLSIQVGMVTDDLDGVLVCTNCTVSAETPELAGSCSLGSRIELALALERKTCNVVLDADSESWLEGILP